MRETPRDIVGAFIFSSDDKLLLGKSRSGGVYTDLWIPPGGGVEPGESKLDAVIREVREETGLDIRNAEISPLDYTQTGRSEKTLRDTGERVLVAMTFYDFAIRLHATSDETPLACEDDIAEAGWFGRQELRCMRFSEPCVFTLQKLGYLAADYSIGQATAGQ